MAIEDSLSRILAVLVILCHLNCGSALQDDGNGFTQFRNQRRRLSDVLKKGKYVADRHRKSFNDAKAFCKSHGGAMVSIANEAQNAEVHTVCKELGNGCWIGIEAPPNPAGWDDVKRWINGEPYHKSKFAKWSPGTMSDIML